MRNGIVVQGYIQTLERVIDKVDIGACGVGFISGEPKYHIQDPSVAKLVKTIAEEINYEDGYSEFGPTPRQKLYWSFDGHGLDSPEEIRGELTNLITAAKNTLSTTTKN